MPQRIIVVDDDPGMQEALREVLRKRGYEEEGAFSAEEALKKMADNSFDLILLDIKLPGMSGLDAIPLIKKLHNQGEIILMTAFGSEDVAREAVLSGAYDYFTKPFSIKEMEIVIKRAIERRRLQMNIDHLRDRLCASGPANMIIGESESIKRVRALIQRVAPLDTTVLITGDSGTGKELVADVIHLLSPRSAGPFVKINCASIPETLLETELCGHEKGAFTGAVAQKQGKFELAHTGTILLDEIGDMPLSLQAKLLRLVEQKQIERLGGKKTITVDIRIVAATNQDLQQLIREKKFREDLYYRLNIASIYLSPLRERKDDLPLLARHFLHRINVKLGMSLAGVSRKGMELLLSHDWPGNVRELANFLERAAILSTGNVLSDEDIGMAFQKIPQVSGPSDSVPPISLGETLEEVEKNLIIQALRESGLKQTAAAKALGIQPKNLWKKIRKHGIDKWMRFHADESSS